MFYDASRLKDGYNIAFFDIDGTLTPRAADTHDGSIPPSERVGAALRQFVEAGNVAVISTGRGPAGTMALLDNYPFAGQVALGGAYAWLGGEVVLDARIEPKAVQALLEFMDSHKLSGSFDGPGRPTMFQAGEAIFGGREARGFGAFKSFEKAEDALADGLHLRSSKVNMIEKDWDVIQAGFDMLDSFEHFYAGARAHELTAKGVTKATGAHAFIDALPQGHGKILAFGDSENDKAVLQIADISVVMGNAPEHLRREATLVTGTVDEDGIADALDELRQIWS